MKEKSIRVRLSEKRYLKLKAYAEAKEKTMTQVVEELIDRLPTVSIDWLRAYVSPLPIPTLDIAGTQPSFDISRLSWKWGLPRYR